MDGPQKVDIELDKLLVNPENYRFKPVTDQQEAILTMLRSQNGKIIKLARDIAEHGLNPMERFLVKETSGGNYVILEGNRRITVLKLMANPDEIPGDYLFKSIFKDLHAQYKDSLPTAVECVVYSEGQQDIADSWVLLKHTGENHGVGTVPWNPVQKDRFESRHKQQELSREVQILEFLESKGIGISGVLPSNLERLISTPAVRHALGFDFSNKKLVLLEAERDVLQRLKKVVQRMSAKDFAVSQIYHAPQRVEWIKDVLAQKPAAPNPPKDTTTQPTTSPSSNASIPTPQPAPSPVPSNDTKTPTPGAPSTPPPPQPSPTPAPPNPNIYYTLVNPTKSLSATAPDKIASIYKELQIVNITGRNAAPHAVAALLRILLEITAQEYLVRKQGFRIDGGNKFRNPAEQGREYDRLDEKLNFIANRCNLPGNLANALRVLVSDQLITTTLNQVMHNTIFRASSTAIKELWQNFEKVFDYLIGEMQ